MNSSKNCKHLRTKSMFIPALAQPGPEQTPVAASSSAHCWCIRTLTETGPDDHPVGPERCQPARSCFGE